MGIREFLVGLVAVVLLLWGPIEHSWPFMLAIRVAYLIVVPIATWWLLGVVWRRWRPDAAAEDRVSRTLSGAMAGALLVGAIVTGQQSYHFDCSQEELTPDGTECVGDFVRVPGPDFGRVAMLLSAGAFAFWLGIKAPEH